MSNTPRTDELKAKKQGASAKHTPLPYGYLYNSAIEIAESEERKNAELRSRIEEMEKARVDLTKFEVHPKERMDSIRDVVRRCLQAMNEGRSLYEDYDAATELLGKFQDLSDALRTAES